MAIKGLALFCIFYIECLLSSSALALVNLNAKTGPYDIEVRKLQACEDSGTGQTMFPTRITKLDRTTYVYSETVYISPTVDEHSKMYVELQELGNQGYRPRSFEYTVKNCAEMFTLAGDNIKMMFKAAGVSIDKCPVPAGNYSVKNFALDFNMAKRVPVMKYGEYRVIMILFHKNKKVGCLMGYGASVPKPGL